MRYCKSFLDYMSEFLLQGASNTWEGKGQVSLPGAAVGVCRVVCVRTRGGCSYRVEVTRSVVGAPPRCEAKANQNTEPAPFAPGAGAPTGWGGAFDCRSTASVRSEVKPKHRACPIRTRGGCSYRVGVTRSVVGAPPRCEAKANQYTEPALFASGAGAPTGVARKLESPRIFRCEGF